MSDPITTIASTAQYASWAASQGITSGTPANLAALLAGATAQLQRYCGREFLPSPADPTKTESRTFLSEGGLTLRIDDALEVTAVAIGTSEVGASLYTACGTPITALKLNPAKEYYGTGLAYWPGLREWPLGAAVTVTGRFGYAEQAALPQDLVEACCMLAAVRALGGGWNDLGVRRVSVINVTVDYGDTAAPQKVAEALALAAPYRRHF